MAEYLEQFILSSNNTFKGKRLCNDMANFHLFDSEFKRIFAEVEGYMNEDKTAKLYSFDETYNWLSSKLTSQFCYLNDISSKDFIFNNYKPFIADCPLPMGEDAQVRKELLSMKVRLGDEIRYEQAQGPAIQTYPTSVSVDEFLKA